jgi:hypothetical protein
MCLNQESIMGEESIEDRIQSWIHEKINCHEKDRVQVKYKWLVEEFRCPGYKESGESEKIKTKNKENPRNKTKQKKLFLPQTCLH